MYKVDLKEKDTKELEVVKFGDLELTERFDIEVWIRKNPSILKEDLLIISEQELLPSGRQPDLLALDKGGNMVIVELKKDDSGKDVYWQAITYAANFSELAYSDIINMYEKYLTEKGVIDPNPKDKIEEFVEEELERINQKQKIVLVSKEFHEDVLRAVSWLRDFALDIKCIKLTPYLDENKQLFILSEVLIPTPGLKDYIESKIRKQKAMKKAYPSPFSLEKGKFEESELKGRIKSTLSRETDLTPRFIAFLEILLSEDILFSRDELKKRLYDMGVGKNLGQTGRYLSNISQLLTKKSTPHLRQIIDFGTPKGGQEGETKVDYKIIQKYRKLLKEILSELEERET